MDTQRYVCPDDTGAKVLKKCKSLFRVIAEETMVNSTELAQLTQRR